MYVRISLDVFYGFFVFIVGWSYCLYFWIVIFWFEDGGIGIEGCWYFRRYIGEGGVGSCR